MLKKIGLLFFLIAQFSFVSPLAANAQDLSNGTAIGIPVIGKIAEGDIITSSPEGYKASISPYDPEIFGVVSLKPAVYFNDTTATKNVPVISNGEVMVRVSSKNGNIASGEFITSSTIPGVGEKATDNGYVLGRAMQSYASNDPSKTS